MRQCCLFSSLSSRYNEVLLSVSRLVKAPTQIPFVESSDVYAPKAPSYEVTKLPNGVTVMTESVIVPSTAHIGIFVDAGTRDETPESSGSSLLLKNVCLKTMINTNETVNYGAFQMAGGNFEMDYTRESIYFRGSCLAHDFIDIVSIAADCAFEPRSVVAVNVGMYKNNQALLLYGALGNNTVFNDQIYATAFGLRTLGMPLLGSKSNVSNLLVDTIQNFQGTYFIPSRVIISAAGVYHHKYFVYLINQKMFSTVLSSKNTPPREKAVYVGGEAREIINSSSIHVVLAFEGADIKHWAPLALAKEILGQHRKSGRIQRQVLLKNVFVENVQVINSSYTDSGLFGLHVTGSASHGKQIVEVAAATLKGLLNITPAELELAKSSLKGNLLRNNTNVDERLEERTKSLYYHGSAIADFQGQVSSVTVYQVQDAVRKALKSQMTFLARGGYANHLQSYDSIVKLLH